MTYLFRCKICGKDNCKEADNKDLAIQYARLSEYCTAGNHIYAGSLTDYSEEPRESKTEKLSVPDY